ncbi:DUF58 domain-containing protein [Halobacillus yeomjeoni]|uniref:DUF58 domain-containing protein n=1 Tax=Halobacillus yeomjeoni TaxID=311194 RepID=UPI001CD5547D|nr:DUF58 domain-containing protein [Halobacillus yeomjeoni]MCA0984563.1 DUF58 domain-containing protein [Halobacillus yeomjeoni]
MSRGDKQVRVPIIAESRGVTKITDLTYHFPHLTKLTDLSMKYTSPYYKEIIVYPEMKPVYGLEDVYHLRPGKQLSTVSPYEDRLTPTSTREYVPQDPFHRIHWKASAKMNALQSKVYERNVDYSWAILVNIGERTRLGNVHVSALLESLLSHASFLCHTAAEKDYPYELMINGKRPHQRPYLHQREGTGRDHLKKSIELLARVSKDQNLMAFEEMLHRFNLQVSKAKGVLILGEMTEESYRYVSEWVAKGLNVYTLVNEGDYATMKPIKKGMNSYVRTE